MSTSRDHVVAAKSQFGSPADRLVLAGAAQRVGRRAYDHRGSWRAAEILGELVTRTTWCRIDENFPVSDFLSISMPQEKESTFWDHHIIISNQQPKSFFSSIQHCVRAGRGRLVPIIVRGSGRSKGPRGGRRRQHRSSVSSNIRLGIIISVEFVHCSFIVD